MAAERHSFAGITTVVVGQGATHYIVVVARRSDHCTLDFSH